MGFKHIAKCVSVKFDRILSTSQCLAARVKVPLTCFALSATSCLNGQSVIFNLYPRSMNRQNSDAIFFQACLKQDMFLLTFLSFTVEEAIRAVVK